MRPFYPFGSSCGTGSVNDVSTLIAGNQSGRIGRGLFADTIARIAYHDVLHVVRQAIFNRGMSDQAR